MTCNTEEPQQKYCLEITSLVNIWSKSICYFKRNFCFTYFAIFNEQRAVILDGRLIAFLEDSSDTMFHQIHSESLENGHLYVLLFLVMAAVGHLGLLSHINLKRLHLQIILTEFD